MGSPLRDQLGKYAVCWCERGRNILPPMLQEPCNGIGTDSDQCYVVNTVFFAIVQSSFSYPHLISRKRFH